MVLKVAILEVKLALDSICFMLGSWRLLLISLTFASALFILVVDNKISSSVEVLKHLVLSLKFNVFNAYILYAVTNIFVDINECENSPCKNRATCENTVGSFICRCAAGYHGKTCADGIIFNFINPFSDKALSYCHNFLKTFCHVWKFIK